MGECVAKSGLLSAKVLIKEISWKDKRKRDGRGGVLDDDKKTCESSTC